jgi:hypothetical protein
MSKTRKIHISIIVILSTAFVANIGLLFLVGYLLMWISHNSIDIHDFNTFLTLILIMELYILYFNSIIIIIIYRIVKKKDV